MLLWQIRLLLLLLPQEQGHGSSDGALVGQVSLPLTGLRGVGQTHHVVTHRTTLVLGRRWWPQRGGRGSGVVVSLAMYPQDFAAIGNIADPIFLMQHRIVVAGTDVATVVVVTLVVGGSVATTALRSLPGIVINLGAAPPVL